MLETSVALSKLEVAKIALTWKNYIVNISLMKKERAMVTIKHTHDIICCLPFAIIISIH